MEIQYFEYVGQGVGVYFVTLFFVQFPNKYEIICFADLPVNTFPFMEIQYRFEYRWARKCWCLCAATYVCWLADFAVDCVQMFIWLWSKNSSSVYSIQRVPVKGVLVMYTMYIYFVLS